jgi:small subunit ribosomal protein S17e
MGRVRTKTVKRASKIIIERYYPKLCLDFEVNKRTCDEVAIISSKRLRNKVSSSKAVGNFKLYLRGPRLLDTPHICTASYSFPPGVDATRKCTVANVTAVSRMKRIQRGPVRGISFKLQEEERERKDQYVPEVSALDFSQSSETGQLDVDAATKDMLKSMGVSYHLPSS